jgi:hypothetical protein
MKSGQLLRCAFLVASAACLAWTVGQPTSTLAAPAQPSAPQDGPFGIAMGESIQNLGQVTQLQNPGWYIVVAPPRPNATFKRILVQAFPATGVCVIKGLGDTFINDEQGVLVRSVVDQTAEALKTKYGAYIENKHCVDEAGSCSEFWAQTLSRGGLTYMDLIDLSQTPRPDHIGLVGVLASASDSFKTWAAVEYHSAAHEECAKAEKATQASSL